MDLSIRQLLAAAEKHKDVEALKNAYDLIQVGTKERVTVDTTASFSPDLYVLCAEQAFQLGSKETSKNCLQMYFKEKPPSNQFLGRAYVCQGQINAPVTAGNSEELDKAAVYFMKAIDFSKKHPRYHFITFNASVLYWTMVRPFLRPGFRRCLIPTLTQVVKALEEIGESDFSWRAQLMLELVECFLDAGKVKDATGFAKGTAEFIEANVPCMYQKIFSLQVRHKLLDPAKAANKAKTNLGLRVIFNIQQLKSQLESLEPLKDSTTKLKNIYQYLMQSDAEHSLCPSDDSLTPQITNTERIALLVDLAHLSLELKCPHVTKACLSDLKMLGVTDKGKLIQIECLQCELELQTHGAKADEYSRSYVEAQQKMIQKLDQTLQNAVRLGDMNAIQVVCVTQWNLCMPLLQHNIRKSIRKQLIRVAEVLEEINSLMFQLRCKIHIEISQIEEADDRIEDAIQHVHKAIHLDDKGVYRECLQTSLHLLTLRGMLYKRPDRPEDQAAMTIEQAKKGNPKGVRKKRPLLVNAGIALAPDAFQVVLDGENEAKVSTAKTRNSLISQLSAKAQHHTSSLQKIGGHLKRLGNHNDKERMRLWATLAKVARKQEVWDVCCAACRFCLLYDDDRWKASKAVDYEKKDDEGAKEGILGDVSLAQGSPRMIKQSSEKDLIRILAQIRLICAEATIYKLRSEGILLNDKAIPPEDKSKHPIGFIMKNPETDPEWLIYRDWIQYLSSYATENLLRAAELGVELHEAWIVCNAAVYIWNYNNHLIRSGRQRELVDTLQTVLAALKQTGHSGETVLLVMLCNTLAQGLIYPWIPSSAKNSDEKKEAEKREREKSTTIEKSKKGSGKGTEKSNSVQTFLLDQNGLQDVKKALEVCEYALNLTNGNVPSEVVPIDIKQQIIVTWIKVKQLLQQQIGPRLEIDDEGKNDTQSAMTKILVGLEMHSCNRAKLMEFSAPNLSVLAKMTSDCSWSDPVVELQAWMQLAHFANLLHDHELVLVCSQRAMQLEEAAAKKAKLNKQEIYDYKVVQEMLSTAACIQGQSIMQTSAGKPHLRKAALNVFELSACCFFFSYAEKARSNKLVMVAARHFWNTCWPLIHSPTEREMLLGSIIKILKAITTSSKGKTDEWDKLPAQASITFGHSTATSAPPVTSVGNPEEDLTLRAAMYGLLFHIFADRKEWEAGLKVLDEAIKEMPRTKHRLLIFKHRVIVKARLGHSIMMDIQKFKDENEDYVSYMWHRVALCSKETVEQLACYQNAIGSLQKPESDWQKVDYLLEFGEWLYKNQFPITDSLYQIEWAIDILLHMTYSENNQDYEGHAEKDNIIPVKRSEIGVQIANTSLSITDLKHVKQLEALIRAHTLMAVISSCASPQHQQHCLMAYAYVMRIWQVSLSAAGLIIKDSLKNPSAPPSRSTPISTPKKDKENKSKQPPPPVREKPKQKGPPDSLPSYPEEWAGYDCPNEVRQAFKQDLSFSSVNERNIAKPTQSLFYLDQLVKELKFLSLTHLTLPVLQLAEVIAHEVMDSKSLSDLYHLRIAQISSGLGFSLFATYHEKVVGTVFIHEEEQTKCRQTVVLHKEKQNQAIKEGTSKISDETQLEKTLKLIDSTLSGKKISGLCVQDMWIQKAEILLELGLYQPARHLLLEAHMTARELNDKAAQAQCLYLFAVLANSEMNHGQAKALLEEAQSIGGDENFWFNLTLCLVKAIIEENSKDKDNMACKVLEHTISVFRSALEERPNRVTVLRFMIASLESKLATIQIESLQHETAHVLLHPQHVKILMASCDTLNQSAKDFFKYGYKEQGVDAMLEHSKGLRMLAKHTDDKELKYRCLLDSYSLMLHAVTTEEETFNNTLSLLQPQEMRNLSLPLLRKLANLKFSLVDLTLDMLHLVCTEEKQQALAEERKGSVQKIVEEFVQCTPNYSSVQQEWVTTGKTLGQVALTQLESIHTLCSSSVEMRAKCLCQIGKCLRLLAVQIDPLHPSVQWDSQFVEEIKLALKQIHVEEEHSQETNNLGHYPITHQGVLQYMSKAIRLKDARIVAQQYLAQASEVLAQAISLSLNNKFTEILAAACLNMLECLGQFDPVSSGQYLALYQSCRASLMMGDILKEATSDTSSSQLAALLHLQHQIHQTKADGTNTLLKTVEQRLTAISKSYTNLSINPQHLNHLNELPPNFKIVILQHSEDRSVLYGAFLDRLKTTGRGIQQAGTLVRTRVARAAVDPEIFSKLLSRVRLHKKEVMQVLLKKEYQRSHNAQQRSMLENLLHNTKGAHNEASKVTKDEPTLLSNFSEIVKNLEDYLNPVISQFDFPGLRTRTPSASTAESGKTKDKDKEDKPAADKALPGAPADMGECVILLADTLLMELPLEALKVLQEDGISSVSRDFSLQLLYNRMHREEGAESDNKKDAKSAKGPKAKGDQKKSIKGVPVSRVLPPNCISVDTHNIKYVVDPYNEARETESVSPVHKMSRILETYNQQFTPYWEGVMDRGHNPSHAELEKLMNSCSAFIFYGTERFLANFIPSKLVAMNFPECQLVIIFDLVQSSLSFLRQSKLDVEKSALQLSLERPLDTAILLSLTGVRSIMANQWHTTLQQNAAKLDIIFENLLKLGQTAGQSVRAVQKSGIQNEPIEAEERPRSTINNEGAVLLVSPESKKEEFCNSDPPEHTVLLHSSFNYVLYGLPNLVIT
ncbi:cilia- and flagella-associated protein 46 [Acipenser oxyrinchus oxyrinchus]|uniref:Cilia- and flagella-associated protein 46 n=1 Tax=Acipenser oxyrinchus oxyrinchus TaxID=40147 RepID=A0AAD8G660_ACIOX|nr:cilia- and flagella-associated protein 46 [Acipenser oxyrinchus oxyrinchus]